MQLTMAMHRPTSFLSSLSPNSPVKYHSRYHVFPQNANDMFSVLSHVLPEQFERESLAMTDNRTCIFYLMVIGLLPSQRTGMLLSYGLTHAAYNK